MNIDRTARIVRIIEQHVPFKDEPFQPHPTTSRVFRTPRSWFGRKTLLRPVAFKPHIHMFETMGCVSSHGGMSAFLWLDDNSQLIKRANDKYVPAKLDTLSDDDIAALEIGIQGDNDLLRAEYDKVHEQMLSGLLR